MTDVPLNATVECADGRCGRSTCVIIKPKTRQVTHIVIKERGLHPTQRLVPVDQVVETTQDLIRLRCTRDELTEQVSFIETQYILSEIKNPLRYRDDPNRVLPDYAVLEPKWVEVRRRHIPKGELAVHRRAQVEATDGHVGRVDEFLVDPKTERITHLVLREGHLWSQREVIIPISEIHHLEENAIRLKIDRHAIDSLPSVPVRRR